MKMMMWTLGCCVHPAYTTETTATMLTATTVVLDRPRGLPTPPCDVAFVGEAVIYNGAKQKLDRKEKLTSPEIVSSAPQKK